LVSEQLKQSKKILVVDDDDAIRNMVERVLRREQFEVESARDGFEAIEKLARNDYGTVLLDLMMPRVDGLGVLRFLETEKPAPQPRVIVMTANLQTADETATAQPVFRILPKPFDIHELVTHVRECHGEHQSDAQPAQAQLSVQLSESAPGFAE
jgi:DNA-binding response OmpR family regulator